MEKLKIVFRQYFEKKPSANIFYDKKQALIEKIRLQICADSQSLSLAQ